MGVLLLFLPGAKKRISFAWQCHEKVNATAHILQMKRTTCIFSRLCGQMYRRVPIINEMLHCLSCDNYQPTSKRISNIILAVN